MSCWRATAVGMTVVALGCGGSTAPGPDTFRVDVAGTSLTLTALLVNPAADQGAGGIGYNLSGSMTLPDASVDFFGVTFSSAAGTTSGSVDCATTPGIGGRLPLEFVFTRETSTDTATYQNDAQDDACAAAFSKIPGSLRGGRLVGSFGGSVRRMGANGPEVLDVTNGYVDVTIPPA